MTGAAGTIRLAVVTVVRDDLPGLLATRASLRAQTMAAYDWFVADGGSGDGTARWLADHRDETVWWRSSPDRGLYDAMNIAMDAIAEGSPPSCSHVLFLNAGDRLADDRVLERLLPLLAAHPDAGLLYGDALEALPGGRLVVKRARSHRRALLGMFTHHQAMVYRLAESSGCRFDLRHGLAADYAFTLSILKQGLPAQRLPLTVCIFAGGGRSQQDPAGGRREQAIIRREVLGLGFAANATLWGLQWLALTLRQTIPWLYAKYRFSPNERSLLS
ncbi:putative colanic acid biosynthesis glycosyltransferase [Azospirillum brasilense]|uniref:Putative colanic acid biosynthesis glycosyltransferase n=1 Tax=Azospirillum brasilense TaxID=192 RepID=A0A560BTW5_AZOBR|nr:glycosyltransferase [Azospirillum brasilense]TWA76046.1 putative colanic acid biosynthesis glycosyltransferase [Azospirillum brasilense]